MLTKLLLIILLALSTVTAKAQKIRQATPDLRETHQKSANKEEAKRTNCRDNEKKFENFDHYGTRGDYPLYGVDLWGWVWMMKRGPLGECKLNRLSRLQQEDYEISNYGRHIRKIFYYEANKLCLYKQEPSDKVIKKLCYSQSKNKNLLAPYFLR